MNGKTGSLMNEGQLEVQEEVYTDQYEEENQDEYSEDSYDQMVQQDEQEQLLGDVDQEAPQGGFKF